MWTSWMKPFAKGVWGLAMIVLLLAPLGSLADVTALPLETAWIAEDQAALVLRGILNEGVRPSAGDEDFREHAGDLRALYEKNGHRWYWSQGVKPTAQSERIIDLLASAEDYGLDPAQYNASQFRFWRHKLASSTEQPTAQNLAEFDVGLSLAVMRFVDAVHRGHINPQKLRLSIDVGSRRPDFPSLVAELAVADEPQAVIGRVEPRFSFYSNLKAGLARYRDLDQRLMGLDVTDIQVPLLPGEQSGGLVTLAARLEALGFPLSAEGKRELEQSSRYTGDLLQVVKHFQRAHGLAIDGVIGPATLAQINTPIAHRVRQIELALERLRWLPDARSGPYIVVNVPSFELYAFSGSESKEPDLVMNVIVGEAANQRNTPMFHADLRHVVFRPYWNVPRGITRKELLPQILRDPSYLARKNFEIVSNFGQKQGIPVTEESIEGLFAGRLKLRQKPGTSNALGLVKFLFPNENNVYLHSTPTAGLFARTRRDFSHGCIRVEDPVALSQFVLAEKPAWTRQRILAAMNGGASKTVTLDQPIPVYIIYSTVVADGKGQVRFFQDIYGHDNRMLEVMARVSASST